MTALEETDDSCSGVARESSKKRDDKRGWRAEVEGQRAARSQRRQTVGVGHQKIPESTETLGQEL